MIRSCEQIRGMLPDYSVGVVDARTRDLVEQHIGACAECASELAALERTGELMADMPMEPAPDLWSAIRADLKPRRAPGFREWLSRYRLPSAVAVTAAAAAMAAWLFVAPPDEVTEPQTQSYMAQHAAMSWREPFANKAVLGLADAVTDQQEVGQ